jgi:DNA-binding transcriptional MerR regulator
MARTPVHMTIGALARAAGVAISTLRFYERRKLVMPSSRTNGDYRLYAHADISRVRFIKRAQELGFTLADVELLLRVSSGHVVKRSQLDTVGAAKLDEIDSRIRDLKRVQRGLKKLLAQPCIDPTQPCPVLTALD